MRRALVLTNEAKRHPFRQTLIEDVAIPIPLATLRGAGTPSTSDMSFFMISFTAFFVIIMGMTA